MDRISYGCIEQAVRACYLHQDVDGILDLMFAPGASPPLPVCLSILQGFQNTYSMIPVAQDAVIPELIPFLVNLLRFPVDLFLMDAIFDLVVAIVDIRPYLWKSIHDHGFLTCVVDQLMSNGDSYGFRVVDFFVRIRHIILVPLDEDDCCRLFECLVAKLEGGISFPSDTPTLFHQLALTQQQVFIEVCEMIGIYDGCVEVVINVNSCLVF